VVSNGRIAAVAQVGARVQSRKAIKIGGSIQTGIVSSVLPARHRDRYPRIAIHWDDGTRRLGSANSFIIVDHHKSDRTKDSSSLSSSSTAASQQQVTVATLRATGWVEGARVRHRQRPRRWPKGIIKTIASGAGQSVRVQVWWEDPQRTKTDACQFYNHDQLILLDDHDHDMPPHHAGDDSHDDDNDIDGLEQDDDDHDDDATNEDAAAADNDDGTTSNDDRDHEEDEENGRLSRIEAKASSIPPSSLSVNRPIDQWIEVNGKASISTKMHNNVSLQPSPGTIGLHGIGLLAKGNGFGGSSYINGIASSLSASTSSFSSSFYNAMPYGTTMSTMSSMMAGLSGPSPILATTPSSSHHHQSMSLSSLSSLSLSMSAPPGFDRNMNSNNMNSSSSSPLASPSSMPSPHGDVSDLPALLLYVNGSHEPISDVLDRCQCSDYIDAFHGEVGLCFVPYATSVLKCHMIGFYNCWRGRYID
jgi:hypothetical protein